MQVERGHRARHAVLKSKLATEEGPGQAQLEVRVYLWAGSAGGAGVLGGPGQAQLEVRVYLDPGLIALSMGYDDAGV